MGKMPPSAGLHLSLCEPCAHSAQPGYDTLVHHSSGLAMKFVFLDRDGTINVNLPIACHRVEDWQFTPNAVEGMRILQDAGFHLAIVTNRAGINQGKYSLEQMLELDRWLENYLAEQNVRIEAIAFCPHAPEEHCHCRKPRTGLATQIEEIVGEIDYYNSWMIGDKPTDATFGKALGMMTALVTSAFWTQCPADMSGTSLYSIAETIPGIRRVPY